MTTTDTATVRLDLRIDNVYGVGGTIVTTSTVNVPPLPPDPAAREKWEARYLFPETGTGRDGVARYRVTVVGSDDPRMVGMVAEFAD